MFAQAGDTASRGEIPGSALAVAAQHTSRTITYHTSTNPHRDPGASGTHNFLTYGQGGKLGRPTKHTQRPCLGL